MPPTAKPPILGNKKEIPNAGEDKVDNTTQEMSDLYSQLMTRSLTDEELLRATAQAPDYRILPDVSVLKIGGQSVIDRGRSAVYPVVEQLATAAKRHKIMIGTGAVTRARHRVEIVSSVRASDIPESGSGGLEHLRGYLNYAEALAR